MPEPVRVYRVASNVRPTTALEASIGIDFAIPDNPSIAVLPFTVMSSDPEQEFFADGVADDIITALSKISRLLVVARNSTFVYKGRAVDVRQVSREQGVRFVLEGSVRLATDACLGGAAEEQPRARELIERAIALDPDYATAWAMRGWLHFTEADVGGGLGDRERFDRAQAAAFQCGHRAVENDPNCAEAYGILALTHLNAGEHDKAIEMSERAVALAPNSAELLGGVASAVMRKSGQPERGAEFVKRAMRLSPFYRPGLLRALGNNYMAMGRLEAAISCYREALRRETGYLAPYVNLTSALGQLGRIDEAREVAEEVLHREPRFSITAYCSGLAYRNSADTERIAAGLRKAGLPK